MEVYLVGGAVRDFLLAKMHQKFKTLDDELQYWATVEKDWVVVASTPTEMLAHGFRQVGKSFPVFLHPQTQEEYALARTEKKISKGYTGFECHASPEVTLEEDLLRRDLTINAMAMRFNPQNTGIQELIDPYGGYQDLIDKRLKHVSQAFAEDPVRILRIARFSAKLGDFTVEDETNQLMMTMVASGEIDALVSDRVWQEWDRSLATSFPWRFMEVLDACNAKSRLFPEINNLPLKKQFLVTAVTTHFNNPIRLSLLLYDLTEAQILDVIKRFRIPNEYRDLALMVAKNLSLFEQLEQLSPEQMLAMFEQTDAFRRPKRFQDFLATCQIISRAADTKPRYLSDLLMQLTSIDNQVLLNKGLSGQEFSNAIRKIRLEYISEARFPD